MTYRYSKIFSDAVVLSPYFHLVTHLRFRFWKFYLTEGLDRYHGVNVNAFIEDQPLSWLNENLI